MFIIRLKFLNHADAVLLGLIRLIGAVALLLSSCLVCGCSNAFVSPSIADLEAVEATDNANEFECMYQGERRTFLLYKPEKCETDISSLTDSEFFPLLIVLHGYADTSFGMRNMTSIDEVAGQTGYFTAYVSSHGPGWNCGMGDSDSDDVGYIKAVVRYLQKEYHCDSDRTFAVGYSNGGFMIQRLAMEAQDTFRAVISVAGKMPKSVWESRSDKKNIGVMQIYGNEDNVVPQNQNGSSQTAVDPAIEEVLDYWVKANQLEYEDKEELSKRTVCTKYSNQSESNYVWNVVIKGGHHSWPDQDFAGFDVNKLILDYCGQFK